MDRIISSIRLVTLTLAGVTLGLESKTMSHRLCDIVYVAMKVKCNNLQSYLKFVTLI